VSVELETILDPGWECGKENGSEPDGKRSCTSPGVGNAVPVDLALDR